jgi:hypothetical protein
MNGVVTRHSFGEGGLLLRRVPPSRDKLSMPCAEAQGGFTDLLLLGILKCRSTLMSCIEMILPAMWNACHVECLPRGMRSLFHWGEAYSTGVNPAGKKNVEMSGRIGVSSYLLFCGLTPVFPPS